MSAARPYSIVLYGATGFTGTLVAKYLAEHAPGLRWAICGRTASKLEAVAEQLYAINPQLRGALGIMTDAGGLNSVVRQAKVGITTAGPFLLHGEPFIRACIEEGTHYIDSTGEFPWVKEMEIKYGAAARASGSIVIPMSGFDSIPADLGTLLAVHRARTLYGKGTGVSAVRAFVAMKGSASGGTLASGMAIADAGSARLAVSAGAAGAAPVGFPAEVARARVDSARLANLLPAFSKEVSRWHAFFMMAPVNTQVVRRSALLLASRGTALEKVDVSGAATLRLPPLLHRLPRPQLQVAGTVSSPGAGYCTGRFTYSEAMVVPGAVAAVLATVGIFILALFMALPRMVRNAVARNLLPQPGSGPSAEQRAASHFRYELVAETDEPVPRFARVRISGGDPGYSETAKMLAESALCLVHGPAKQQQQQLPGQALGGGFLTPATALGFTLARRLAAAGMRIEAPAAEGGAGGALPPPQSSWQAYPLA